MKGRRKSLSLAVVMIFFINMIIFGEIPDESVIIGSKGYSLKYAKEEKNVEEIREAIRGAQGRILVKKNNKWFLNDGTEVNPSEVPEIIYKYYDGKESRFHKGDGDEITGFVVKEVKYAGGGHIHIVFSREVSEESVLKKENYVIKQKDDIGIRKIELIKADVVMIELEKLYFDNEAIDIFVKEGIKDKENNTLEDEYTQFLEVNDYVKEKEVKKGVKLVAPKLRAIKEKGYVNLQWNSIDGADYYNIYRGTTGSAIKLNTTGASITMDKTTGSSLKLYKSKIKETWYKDEAIKNELTYIYSVSAVDRGVEGDMSEIVRADKSSLIYDSFDYRDSLDPKADTDNDGLINEREYELGTNVYEKDSDYDGVDDNVEVQKNLDPTNPDTDGDGIYDGAELEFGMDPLKSEESRKVSVVKGLDDEDVSADVILNGEANINYAKLEIDDNTLLKGYSEVIGSPVKLYAWSMIEDGEISIGFDPTELLEKGIEKNDLSVYKILFEEARAIKMESSIDGDRVKGKVQGAGTYVIGSEGLENKNLSQQDIVIGIDMSEMIKEKDYEEKYEWKASIKDIIQRTAEGSRVAIIQNNTRIEEVQEFTTDKLLSEYGIEDMYYKEVSGESDVISLIEKAEENLEEKNDNGKVIVLLLSDYDVSKQEQIKAKLKEANNKGISVYIIAVLTEKDRIDMIKELNEEPGITCMTTSSYSRISSSIGVLKRNLIAFEDVQDKEEMTPLTFEDSEFARKIYSKPIESRNNKGYKKVILTKDGETFNVENHTFSHHNFHVDNKTRFNDNELYYQNGHCSGIVLSEVLGYHGYLPARVTLNELDLELAAMDSDFDFKKRVGDDAYNIGVRGSDELAFLKRGLLCNLSDIFEYEYLRMFGYWVIRNNYGQNDKYWSKNNGGYLIDERVNEIMDRIDEGYLIYAGTINRFDKDKDWFKKDIDGHGHSMAIYGYEIKDKASNGAITEIDFNIYEPNERKVDHILKFKRKSRYSNKWNYEVEFDFGKFDNAKTYSYKVDGVESESYTVTFRNFIIFKSWEYFKDIEEANISRLSKVSYSNDDEMKEFQVKVQPFKEVDFQLYDGEDNVTSKYSVEVDRSRGIYKFKSDEKMNYESFAAVASVEYDENSFPNLLNSYLVWNTKFDDVDMDHWAYKYILEAGYRDLIKGYDDGSFRPDGQITRAELLTLVMRGANVDLENYVPSNGEYVNPEHWAKKQITMAVEEGWINVQNGGGSLPNEKVTRDEVAGIVWRIFNSDKAINKGKIVKYDNSQLRVQERFTDYYKIKNAIEVMQLQGNRAMEGFPDGEFKPQSYITRAEICKILIKVLGE